MKINLIKIIAAFFLLAIYSCKKSEVTTTSFDENIKIKMVEVVDSVNRTLSLNCYTEKMFGCSNYGIETAYSLTGDKITITFVKILYSNICLTSIGPASTVINITGLANKIYTVDLVFGTNKISGQLNVSSGSFVATLPSQTKVQFVNPDLKRVPDNTIYGTVHYHATSTAPTVQKFIDSLQFYGAITALYPQGDYGRFQIEASGQINQTQDLGYYFTRYYIFNFSGGSVQVKNLVKRFGVNYPNLLLITLYTAKGETFYSWTP